MVRKGRPHSRRRGKKRHNKHPISIRVIAIVTEQTPPNPLEEAIARVAEAQGSETDEDTLVSNRRDVLYALAGARVSVLLETAPETVDTPPETGTPLLFVTDGDDHEQAMLALFTRPDWALAFHATEGGDFSHPAEVPAPWALLQVPPGAGVMINPNRMPTFRIGPEVAGSLRDETMKSLESLQQNGGSPSSLN